jgi:hypothetical protein
MGLISGDHCNIFLQVFAMARFLFIALLVALLCSYSVDARLLIDQRSTTIVTYAKDQSLRAADASLAAYYDEDDESASFMVTWIEDSMMVIEKEEEEEDLLSRYRSAVQGSFRHVLDFISAIFARHPTSSEPSGVAYSGDSVIDDPELFGDA